MVVFMETCAELNMVLLLIGIQEIANAHIPLFVYNNSLCTVWSHLSCVLSYINLAYSITALMTINRLQSLKQTIKHASKNSLSSIVRTDPDTKKIFKKKEET